MRAAGFDDFLIMDLLRHWNLRERPFEATWDTRFFYAGPDHEEALSRLADAVIRHLVRGTKLLVVALGKYGGGELTFGSDLDLLLIAPEPAAAQSADGVETRSAHLQFSRATDSQGDVGEHPQDKRLKPPLVTAVA